MLEDEVSQRILMEAPKHNCHLLRNNSGAFTNEAGRNVRFGLGNVSKRLSEQIKSSDFIGITEVLITPDMLGCKIGVFTAIEVKRSDWKLKIADVRERAQKNFIDFIQSKGGIAGFCNSVESFIALIKKQ